MPPKRKSEYKPEYSKKFQGIRKGKDTFHAHCIPCNDEISLTSIGKHAITLHQKTSKHIQNARVINI
uniref:BED-type domain-containing protein n=1 Tax=Acrobeloides nanus TaxID=290746 RepID=A0A914D6M4_9BILA